MYSRPRAERREYCHGKMAFSIRTCYGLVTEPKTPLLLRRQRHLMERLALRRVMGSINLIDVPSNDTVYSITELSEIALIFIGQSI